MTVTIQEVIDRIREPAAERANPTVDGLRFGEPDTIVRGIAVSFMPTVSAIERSIAMGANLLIAHEGVYYSHQERAEGLRPNGVYERKRRLIEESGLAIYRCHDDVHRYVPDGITWGLIEALGWEDRVRENRPAASLLTIPAMTVGEAASYVKERLGLPFVRVVGDRSMSCERVGILVGYRGGGATVIPLLESDEAELIITGEGPEWEAPEYIRDSASLGQRKALIVIGHAESESPGMAWLCRRLQEAFPRLSVRFLADKPVFDLI
jgi:Uncharacterized conserved protein